MHVQVHAAGHDREPGAFRQRLKEPAAEPAWTRDSWNRIATTTVPGREAGAPGVGGDGGGGAFMPCSRLKHTVDTL